MGDSTACGSLYYNIVNAPFPSLYIFEEADPLIPGAHHLLKVTSNTSDINTHRYFTVAVKTTVGDSTVFTM